ncbi:MAG TPA: NADPH:quinone reductase, partial [Armatimonadota bacterium]|nr:NADPH:quinone reductase [Armatimonadota bacterium]
QRALSRSLTGSLFQGIRRRPGRALRHRLTFTFAVHRDVPRQEDRRSAEYREEQPARRPPETVNMKAIRVHEFGPPSVLQLEELPDPQPAPGQVVVRVRAAGVNPVDTYIRAGSYARKPVLPYTPGTDAAGIVERIGDGVTNVRPGDRVYTAGSISGTYAELALCHAEQVQPLPENISFSQGAGVFVPYATAYRALFQRARAQAGETVLVHGATGGVGTAAVQLAHAHGLTVIGTGGTEEGRELVRQQGADHVLDHHAPGYLEQLMQLTDGRGVDLVLEMLANVNLGKDLTVLAQGGRVVVIGSRGTVEINPRETMAREAAVLGMMLWGATEKELAGLYAALHAGLANGTLRPIVGREFPLAEAPRAHEAVMEPGAAGKIVLVP